MNTFVNANSTSGIQTFDKQDCKQSFDGKSNKINV